VQAPIGDIAARQKGDSMEYNIVDTFLGEQIRRDDGTYLASIYRGKAKWVTDWLYARAYKDASKILERLQKGELA
jgi:hypothetical protein